MMKLTLLCALVASAYASSWNYDLTDTDHGPTNWPDDCVLPDSTSQSPVNIVTGSATSSDYTSDFALSGYTGVSATMKNNGHTVVIELSSSANATITGGDLPAMYKLAQFHFHWGSNNTIGSEHKINGHQEAMEVHFVHYKYSLESLSSAASQDEGLAVLAFMFEINSANSAYNTITSNLPLAQGSTVSLSNLDITTFMGPIGGTSYRYGGSLTTPPCYESVIWTVFYDDDDRIEISSTQMNKFRAVVDSDNHAIANNFRPTQLLNSRTVKVDD